MKSITTISFCLSCLFVSAQKYKVESFVADYDTLEEYISVCNENVWLMEYPGYFGRDFDLGFDFPFFDTTFNIVTILDGNIADFGNSLNYSLYMFGGPFSVYYAANPMDYEYGRPVESDWRYKHDVMHGQRVFIMEQRHVGAYAGWAEALPYSRGDINFQFWLWENGDIEIRFGIVEMDSTVFIPGPFGGITPPDTILTGLHSMPIGIQDLDTIDQIFLNGTFSNYTIDRLDNSNLDDLPKPNTGIRFKYQTTRVNEETHSKIILENPVNNILSIATDLESFKYTIYDLSGRINLNGSNQSSIDVSLLTNGLYILEINSGGKIFKDRFLKI